MEKMAQQQILFSKDYTKLDHQIFDTFRWNPSSRDVGSVQHCITPTKRFYCIVQSIEKIKLGDIPLDIINQDISPDSVKSSSEFAEYMNGLYKSDKICLTTVLTKFRLKKLL